MKSYRQPFSGTDKPRGCTTWLEHSADLITEAEYLSIYPKARIEEIKTPSCHVIFVLYGFEWTILAHATRDQSATIASFEPKKLKAAFTALLAIGRCKPLFYITEEDRIEIVGNTADDLIDFIRRRASSLNAIIQINAKTGRQPAAFGEKPDLGFH